MSVVKNSHTRSSGIERHFHSCSRGVAIKTHCRANSQGSLAVVNSSNGGLLMTEDVGYSFEGEQQSLVKLRRGQHLRRSFDENIVLTKIVIDFGFPDRCSRLKSQFCRDFTHRTNEISAEYFPTDPLTHFLSTSTIERRRVPSSIGSAPGVRAGRETAGVKPTASAYFK